MTCPSSILLCLALLQCLAQFLVLGPVTLLALLAARADLLTLAALLQPISFFKLVVGLATSWAFASISEEIVRGTIVLVVSKSSLELFLHGGTETGIANKERVFGGNWNRLVIDLKHFHILRFDGGSKMHRKNSWIKKLAQYHASQSFGTYQCVPSEAACPGRTSPPSCPSTPRRDGSEHRC
jgi:hypothetical protein